MLVWSRVRDALRCPVEVRKAGTLVATRTTTTTVTVTIPLAAGSYTWTVQACNNPRLQAEPHGRVHAVAALITAYPHRSRSRGRISFAYSSMDRRWSSPGKWKTRCSKPSSM